jgi:hypothetical protein
LLRRSLTIASAVRTINHLKNKNMARKVIDTILVYIDPELKRALRGELALNGKSISEWVREKAREYIEETKFTAIDDIVKKKSRSKKFKRSYTKELKRLKK